MFPPLSCALGSGDFALSRVYQVVDLLSSSRPASESSPFLQRHSFSLVASAEPTEGGPSGPTSISLLDFGGFPDFAQTLTKPRLPQDFGGQPSSDFITADFGGFKTLDAIFFPKKTPVWTFFPDVSLTSSRVPYPPGTPT